MKKSSSSSKSSKKPAVPTPANEYTTINGRPASSRVFNKATNSYTNDVALDPYDQQSLDTSRQGMASMLGQLQGMVPTSEADRQRFTNALYDPQKAQLQQDYFRTLGEAEGAANASGVRNSIGFENYRANEIDKNLQQGLSDLYNQSYLQSFDLPRLQMAPIADALGLYDAAIQGIHNRGMQTLDPSFQGSQATNNFNLQSYMAGLNTPQQSQQKRSFFSSLF